MPTKEYIIASEQAVMGALRVAVQQNAMQPVTVGKVIKAALASDWNNKAIATPIKESYVKYPRGMVRRPYGGYNVFDFSDRTKRFLDRLVRYGDVQSTPTSRGMTYIPFDMISLYK